MSDLPIKNWIMKIVSTGLDQKVVDQKRAVVFTHLWCNHLRGSGHLEKSFKLFWVEGLYWCVWKKE